MDYKRYCEYCGEHSGKYELCYECYNLAKEDYIFKNDKNEWVKNPRKGNEYKFYDETKNYSLKQDLLNEYEMEFFNIVRSFLNPKYVIIPQVNLQTIVSTDTNTRNDELFRNIDFIIFHTENYVPFLAIELNGQQHYTNEYWKERDKSVKSILKDIELPLLTIDIKDLKHIESNQIQKIMKQVIKYLNPGFLSKILGKKNDKMDLTWAEEQIKKLG
ncbi:MAG: DUF2726 domain-containing protein [Clostridia bacterium]|nr:DUF2726 domain-containing protein [Clostridia bacterium]